MSLCHLAQMMDKLSQLWRRLLFYVRRDHFDRELEEEMRFHLEMKAEETSPREYRQRKRAAPHDGNSAIKHYFRK